MHGPVQYIEFEKPIADLASKIEELRHLSNNDGMNIAEEISRLQVKLDKTVQQVYSKLTPWQKVQLARHAGRPRFLTYLNKMFCDFVPLRGDRFFGEDQAIVGGLASFEGRSVVVIGNEKGHDTETRVQHNFGMARPEGYRKVQRLMKMASHFQLPLLTFVDTAGAYPGIEAEERGQAEAIAKCLEISFEVDVPIIATIIGEGGSGGAVAMATANSVLMLEHAIYSVISPEGCASILWRDGTQAEKAAQSQKLTAQDLKELKIIDTIIPEPLGGAHRDFDIAVSNTREALLKTLKGYSGLTSYAIKEARSQRFEKMGIFV